MKDKEIVIRTVPIGEYQIRYQLLIKKVKNLNLRIKTDNTIIVSAPKGVSVEYIDNFVKSKAEFILDAMIKFKKIQKNSVAKAGDKINFIGKPYTVRIYQRSKNSAFIKSSEEEFIVFLKDVADAKMLQSTIDKWQKFAADEIFPLALDRVAKKYFGEDFDIPTLKIRRMKARWGSCDFDNRVITLNTMLLEAPIYAIDYVILHELVHLFHPNHSKSFHDMVANLMPDWKKRKEILNGYYRIRE